MNESKRGKLWIHLLILIGTGVLLLALCGAVFGRHYVEKMLTQLALPCGLIWLMLLVVSYFAIVNGPKRLSIPLLFIFLFYWTTGCSYTGELMASHFERRYSQTDLDAVVPYDCVIVLGGGTRSNDEGDAWLGNSGDRLMLAARLYKQGKARQLVATGQAYSWAPNQSISLSESTAQIWRDLGIPAADIWQVEGRNTSEEMKNIRTFLGEYPAGRVGLLTSATHLPRAQRLAKAHGLTVIPIAADFQTGALEPAPLSLIPSRAGFFRTEICTKELLAALVGR